MEYYHGQELESKFLDDLWLSVLNKVPADKWVQITKNNDKVVAGIKHFIDCACFGEPIEMTLNDNHTKFMKNGIKRKT